MAFWTDLIGTLRQTLRIGGSTGTTLKNSSGNLVVRNAADSADAELTTSKLNNSGDSVVLNSDATSTGADWKFTLARPTSGMTADVTLTFPFDDGTPGQVLQTDGNGVLDWVSAAATGHLTANDTTDLVFGTTSPLTLFTLPANAVIDEAEVVIDTAFNGTPTLSLGISGNTSKYMGSTENDLTQTAETRFITKPGKVASGSTEALIATYSAGGASAGAARIIIRYSVPA